MQTGLYLRSAEGRKQKNIADTIGQNLLTKGYCVDIDLVLPERHPEQGPVWEWIYNNRESVCDKLGGNYHKEGPGAQRKLDAQTFKEMQSIIELTGGKNLITKLQNEE
jgi:heterodisulfide reductase subunit C